MHQYPRISSLNSFPDASTISSPEFSCLPQSSSMCTPLVSSTRNRWYRTHCLFMELIVVTHVHRDVLVIITVSNPRLWSPSPVVRYILACEYLYCLWISPCSLERYLCPPRPAISIEHIFIASRYLWSPDDHMKVLIPPYNLHMFLISCIFPRAFFDNKPIIRNPRLHS